MKEKFIALLTFTSSLKNFGIKFIRVAILVVFVWIGGLKYFHYEADGIVPFVANSPFMSFFYAKDAPEYKDHKNPEGAFVPENRAWHEANRTYTFSYGLGALIMSIGILVFLGIFFPKVALVGDTLAIIMTLGTLSFLVTTPKSGFRIWVEMNLASAIVRCRKTGYQRYRYSRRSRSASFRLVTTRTQNTEKKLILSATDTFASRI